MKKGGDGDNVVPISGGGTKGAGSKVRFPPCLTEGIGPLNDGTAREAPLADALEAVSHMQSVANGALIAAAEMLARAEGDPDRDVVALVLSGLMRARLEEIEKFIPDHGPDKAEG